MNHISGLAKAIFDASGPTIQSESTERVNRNGKTKLQAVQDLVCCLLAYKTKLILYKGMIEEKDGRQDNEIEFLHRTRK